MRHKFIIFSNNSSHANILMTRIPEMISLMFLTRSSVFSAVLILNTPKIFPIKTSTTKKNQIVKTIIKINHLIRMKVYRFYKTVKIWWYLVYFGRGQKEIERPFQLKRVLQLWRNKESQCWWKLEVVLSKLDWIYRQIALVDWHHFTSSWLIALHWCSQEPPDSSVNTEKNQGNHYTYTNVCILGIRIIS